MKVIGIVVEYNPFHNGHLYQIIKVKEIYNDSIIIVCMSSSFTQRGDISILNKWDKTKIALFYGVDLVIELPYVFSSQSADIFAYGAINMLKELKIDTLVFGSESNDINKIIDIAKVQLNNKKFDIKVKAYINEGNNYPTSLSKAIFDLTSLNITSPNDLLSISYVKEILKDNSNIDIIPIKRTNDYHDLTSNNEIISATNIRNKIDNNIDIKKFIPEYCNKFIENVNYDLLFKILKYKILSERDNLKIYNTVDEGIESRLYNSIIKSNNIEELINNIKTKRYTYNKIKRMLSHILVSFSKEDALKYKKISYIKILGFSNEGREYLNKIKKDVTLPLLTKYEKGFDILDFEIKITSIYSILVGNKDLISMEYENHVIKK